MIPKRAIISTHHMLYGAADALRDYLNNKKIDLVLFIGLPLAMQRESLCELYKKGKKIEFIAKRRSIQSSFLSYFIDIFHIVNWSIKKGKKADVFFGVDPLNCIVGLFLKKIGIIEKVIFYSIDFSPIRFRNKIINSIYHFIEKVCVVNAGEAWNVSPRIAEGREEFLQIKNDPMHQIVVPIGIWSKNIKKRDFKDIKKHQLLFVGHLLEKQGVQLVLDAIPDIIRRIPDFKFLVVGGGEYLDVLKKKVITLHIEKYVEFMGWIQDRFTLDSMMSESACAIAVYKPEKEKLYNFTYYADPTKLKDYLGAGLPIILTDIPYNAKEIQAKRCGILVGYKKENIADTIINFLSNDKILKEYRQNTLLFAKEYDWEKVFDKAFL